MLRKIDKAKPKEENSAIKEYRLTGKAILMKNNRSSWLLRLAYPLPLLLLLTGCATPQAHISSEVAAKVKKVAIYEEISTPTSLSTPFRGGGGGILGAAVGAAVQAKNQNKFTQQVGAKLDFQEFASQTTRELVEAAIKKHPGWTFVPASQAAKADTMLVLEVASMGVEDPPTTLIPTMKNSGYHPVVSICATWIANPPFEIIRGDAGLQTTDPDAHPVLFKQVGRATKNDLKKGYSSRTLTGDAEVFKSAFREAFEIAVQKLENAWTPQVPVQ